MAVIVGFDCSLSLNAPQSLLLLHKRGAGTNPSNLHIDDVGVIPQPSHGIRCFPCVAGRMFHRDITKFILGISNTNITAFGNYQGYYGCQALNNKCQEMVPRRLGSRYILFRKYIPGLVPDTVILFRFKRWLRNQNLLLPNHNR